MNSIVLAVVVMMALSLVRVPVILALIIATFAGGMSAGMSVGDVIVAFEGGLGNGATIALSYALLGAFAVALSRSGITHLLAEKIVGAIGAEPGGRNVFYAKMLLCGALLLCASLAETIIPVHIAFIPILVPPLLEVMDRINLDRRAAACAVTCGLILPYMLLPVGFGADQNTYTFGLDQPSIAIPEPASWLLVAAGGLIGLVRRRRRS